jgi:ferredoxin
MVRLVVHVDQEKCQAHALCSLVAPGVFGHNDVDGQAFVLLAEVPTDRWEQVRRAALGCPENAIVISTQD